MGLVWAVTGPPGVGKSTLVSRVVLRLKSAGVIVGGFTTVERRTKGVRVGFDIRDLTDGRTGELASTATRLGPRVGRYRVNLSDLSNIGADALLRASISSELIIVDELGPMELVSPAFRRAVKSCIESGRPVIVVIHERMEDDLLSEVRAKAVRAFALTVENRDLAERELGDEVLAAMGSPKAS